MYQCDKCKWRKSMCFFHDEMNCQNGQITEHLCIWCNKPFIKVGRKEYCSQDCQHKAWESRNKEKLRVKHLVKNNKYYKKLRAEIDELKLSRHCAICGYSKYAGALDFHHIDPKTKSKEIGIGHNYKDEVDKHIVLCSNCHREIHELMKKDLDSYKILIEAYKNNPVKVGQGTKLWKFVNLLPGAEIGANCSIGAFTEIGIDVKIGNNCKIQNGVFIPKGVTIGNSVFLGPRCMFTNDRYPSAKDYGKFEQTIVEDDVSIGCGAIIRCGITLGRGCRVGAGAVVTKDVAPGSLVVGIPAKEVIE